MAQTLSSARIRTEKGGANTTRRPTVSPRPFRFHSCHQSGFVGTQMYATWPWRGLWRAGREYRCGSTSISSPTGSSSCKLRAIAVRNPWMAPPRFQRQNRANREDPTEAQIRWQISVALAYGATGLLYFEWHPMPDGHPGLVMTVDGPPLPSPHWVRVTTAHRRHLAHPTSTAISTRRGG